MSYQTNLYAMQRRAADQLRPAPRRSPVRAILHQARRELTVLEQIGEFVVLPLCCCILLGAVIIVGALSNG